MRTIQFAKMQGLGNDFILVEYDEINKNNIDISELAKKICDRNFGVGADGLIIVNPQDMLADTDTCWRIINSDGSEPQMCGNGIRCFAKYVHEKGLVDKNKFTVNTLAGVIIPEILTNGDVRVDMGAPILDAKLVPCSCDTDKVLDYTVTVDDKQFNINAVSMGNPHCIIFTDENTKDLALKYGPKLEVCSYFPEKTNVEFVNIISRNHIKLDVWERGCGITLACGTGTCATVVASILNGLTDNKVKVDLPGGQLLIEWSGKETDSVFMSGAAEFVFTGEFRL